jgi:internalin A
MLTNLTALSLAENLLVTVPDSLGGLSRLERLYIDQNQLRSIPETIGQLGCLRELNLSCNQLGSVPATLGQLVNLEKLYLYKNRLTSVPDSLGQLCGLQELSLSDNRLASVPDTLGKLIQIKNLYLSYNRLTSLPETLGNLAQLERLSLHGNDGLGIPAEIMGPTMLQISRDKAMPASPHAVLDYYFGTRRPNSARALNEAKMTLVGWGAVGKTSLVERLVHGRFDDKQEMTEGIAISEWMLKLNSTEDIRLHVWDFGGQEIMHGTHQFFLSKRSLYLLVLNGRQGHEDADAEYWLTLIQSFGPDCPVLVVLNKIDEQPFDLNRAALKQKYPQIVDFYRTDCKAPRGLEELQHAIERETDRLHDLRAKFPASWFTIKQKIPKSGNNFMTFAEYRTFCSENGESNEAEQDKLADFLHCLGIAINFHDDARLRSTHVLNPHWITKGIYTIINDKTLEANKGLFRDADLNRILTPKEYPSEMHSYVTDLMKKFEQCFLFQDQDGQYLIPQLLPKEEPPAALEFKAEECLNFEYHYRVVPEGLLPRFIVRTHVMSQDQGRWRTGAILSFEGNTALVKADAHDRKVTIRVKGTQEGRRRLLAIIRSDFERIHADIRNLNPHEMVPVPGFPTVAFKYRMARLSASGNSVVRCVKLRLPRLSGTYT